MKLFEARVLVIEDKPFEEYTSEEYRALLHSEIALTFEGKLLKSRHTKVPNDEPLRSI